MELKDFIKTTLKELSEAIDESGVELGKKVTLTNIALRNNSHGSYGLIDFDLAVEAQTSEKTDKGGGIKISVVHANLGKGNEITSSSTSRIKFTVEADFNSFNAQMAAKSSN